MAMETRCSKVLVFFPNYVRTYSKKKPAEDTLVPPLWGKRGKKCFFLIILFTLSKNLTAESHEQKTNDPSTISAQEACFDFHERVFFCDLNKI